MRRLFSTFAYGWPGFGLLLMRLAAGSGLIVHAVEALRTELAVGATTLIHVLMFVLGMLVLAGLWTPVAGALVAVSALWDCFSKPTDAWFHVTVAAVGAALALLGPGAWSVDARLFGWKRVEIPDQNRQDPQDPPA